MDISLSIGAPPENREGRHVYWGLRKMDGGGPWKWSVSHCGNSVRGTWRGGSFTGYPEGYAK